MSFDMPRDGSWEVRAGWLVRRYGRDLSIAQFQAAGLVGNFGAETEGFKYSQEIAPRGGRGGLGWAQWTGPRRTAFEEFCADVKLKPTDDEANFLFVLKELNGTHKRFLDRLRTTTTIELATRLTHIEYETPKDVLDKTFVSFPKRLEYAKRALRGVRIVAAGTERPYKVEQARKAMETAARRYQELLRDLGFYTGDIDGLFGPDSWTAHLAYLKLYGAK